MRHVTRGLSLVLALAVPGSVYGQELLRWRYRVGDNWEYRLTQNTSTEVLPLRSPDSGQLMGESMSQSQVQILTLVAAVRDVGVNGNTTIDWTHTRAQMSTEVQGMSLEWDSDRPDAGVPGSPLGAMVRPLEAMLGQTLTVVATPRGEIVEVRGGEAMLAAMLEGVDPAIAAMMQEQMGPMFDEERIASQFTGGIGTLPEGPVTAGDSWTVRFQVPAPMLGGDMTSETLNTVAQFEVQSGERVALIRHEGTVEFDDSGQAGGLPMTIEVSDASVGGSTTFSLDRGLILTSTSTSNQVITMSMPAAGVRQRVRTASSAALELVGPATPRE